ncbi:hypothetical protein [Hymenobacter cellulosivorans]|uniref:DUF3575 domain-containing protein n=1 Tax=Hymenobacter cellulosivorans TaxID=2932249 RepID=A0ABY4F534_9BACT|nr:hypothetical protein [Hymenobacter cellulosivorans]UOQ51410.1 hypothetical protein MUN80_16770 [Hymenobacter cellulosivorans]
MKTTPIALSLGGLVGTTLSMPAYCQALPSPALLTVQVEKVITAFAINYLGASVGQERRLGSSVTFLYGLGAHYSYYSTGFPIGGTRFLNVLDPVFGRDYSTGGITPYAFGEFRLYHTLFHRASAGKDIRHNAANYFALFGEQPLAKNNLVEVPNLAIASVVGLKYGLRRSLGAHLSVDGSVGIANKISRTQHTLLPRLDLGVAWQL